MAFGGTSCSSLAGTRGSGGGAAGGFATMTSVFVRMVGGVSGSTSGVVTGSGIGGGGGETTSSVGMKSGRGVEPRKAPQKIDKLVSAVRCTTIEVTNALAREECITAVPFGQA
jgi:hypothetical protein